MGPADPFFHEEITIWKKCGNNLSPSTIRVKIRKNELQNDWFRTSNKVHFFKSLKDLQSKPVLVCSGSNVSIYHINTFCHIPIIWNFNMALKIFSHIIKHSSCRKEKNFFHKQRICKYRKFQRKDKEREFSGWQLPLPLCGSLAKNNVHFVSRYPLA